MLRHRSILFAVLFLACFAFYFHLRESLISGMLLLQVQKFLLLTHSLTHLISV